MIKITVLKDSIANSGTLTVEIENDGEPVELVTGMVLIFNPNPNPNSIRNSAVTLRESVLLVSGITELKLMLNHGRIFTGCDCSNAASFIDFRLGVATISSIQELAKSIAQKKDES